MEIRSRVSAYLSEIHFTDGQLVKKGDLLFVIDHKPFQIALDQMRADPRRRAPIYLSPKPISPAARSWCATRR